MSDKIKIKETRQADTRLDGPVPSKEVLLTESIEHIKAVSDCMSYCARFLEEQGKNHDHTKIEYIDEFYANFVEVMKNKQIKFKSLSWWQKHLKERHHLKDRVPDDVNLFDILEMICDGICAGLARNGKYYHEPALVDVLEKAYNNTVELLLDLVKVEK